MSTPPPIEPTPEQLPPPVPAPTTSGDPGEGIHRAMLWCLTLSLVGLFVYMHIAVQKPGKKGPKRNRISPEFRVSSRYAVGGVVIQRDSSTDKEAIAKTAKTYREQAQKAAKTSMDRVALIPVIQEIAGKEEAIKHAKSLLKEFTPEPEKKEEKTEPEAEEAPEKPEADVGKAKPKAQKTVDPKQELHQDTQAFLTVLEEGPAKLDKKATQRLTKRYKWYADLALSSDAPKNDPVRVKALSRARLTLGVIIIGVICAFLGGLAGITILVSWIVAWYLGKVKMYYPEDDRVAASKRLIYFETFVLLLGSLMLIPATLAMMGIRMHWTIHGAMVLLVGWLAIRKVPWKEALRGLGWHGGTNPVFEVFWGICGYLAGLPVIVLGLILTSLLSKAIAASGLEKVVPKDASHPIVEQLQQGGFGRIVVLMIMACVFAPLLEETFFRGAFYHYLRSRGGAVIAILVSAFLFAAVHPQSIAGIPALMSIGIVLAWLREWRGSIIASITAHACNNLVVVGLAIILLT